MNGVATDRRRGTEALGYRPALDGVRGIAIILVLAAHYTAFVPGGTVGVDLFFVLSGFLITTLLLEEHGRRGRISLGRFYARRALRLLPALAVLIVVCVLWDLLTPSRYEIDGTTRAVPGVVFYVSNWLRVMDVPLGLFEHTWSLAIEEQFYLFWPPLLILLLAARGRRRLALTFCLVTAAVACLVRVVGFAATPTLARADDLYNAVRADGLLIGCGVALAASLGLFARGSERSYQRAAVAGGVVFMAVAVAVDDWRDPFFYWGGLTLVALAGAALIVRVVHVPSPTLVAWLSVPWLVHIGRISYGIYLWHSPVGEALEPRLASLPGGAATLLMVALSYGCALASFRLVERPALRLKARFRPPVAPVAERVSLPGREPTLVTSPEGAPTGGER